MAYDPTAVNVRKAAGYAVLSAAADRVSVRKATGYAVLDAAGDRIGVRKATGYAVLHDTAILPLPEEPATLGAHFFWRIFITAMNDSSDYCSAAEIELRGVPGGPQLAQHYDRTGLPSTGYAEADIEHYSTGEPGFAADSSDPSLQWWGGRGDPPHWWQFSFNLPTAITEVAISASNWPSEAPRDFQVQFSSDGANWMVGWEVTGQVDWTTPETRVFTYNGETPYEVVPPPPPLRPPQIMFLT